MIITNTDTRNHLASHASYWLSYMEDGAPQKYPDAGIGPNGMSMELSNPSTCLIGEMHGCNDDYCFEGSERCDACIGMCLKIMCLVGHEASPHPPTAEYNLNEYLDSVVEHFTAKHPEGKA